MVHIKTVRKCHLSQCLHLANISPNMPSLLSILNIYDDISNALHVYPVNQ